MDYEQKERRFSIGTPSGEEDLLLHSMTVQESVSSLFRIKLDMYSEKDDLAFDDLIGKPLSIRMRLPEEGDAAERYFHGIVARFAQGPPEGNFITYEAEVVPWLWLLTRGSDCRIFQQETLPDIITTIFDDLGMTDYKLSLKGTYPKLEYAVQYRETHFNFVSRLMEEAGIAYYFEHGEKEHTLVLFDDPSENPTVPYAKEASYATAEDAGRPAGEIEDWHVEQELPSGKYAVTDYNFEDPSMDLMANVSSSISIGNNDRFELYDYPGEYAALSDGERKAKLRMEAEETASHSIERRSARGDFSAGHTFDLIGHYRDDFNQTYLITSISHHMTQGYGGDADPGASYSNHFNCIPHSVPFRPPQRTAKPAISGVQTATVVGASGEEIDVDEYGRIVVQFHWDRLGKNDEKSSCRIRVAQSWAGKGWGAIYNPRIGQEVIVEFLEGDPDRPIVTGRVYNGEQKVPYELPSDKTQSGQKSRSSKGGGTDNFNEIRFEDKEGSEMFSVQAEKDLERLVKNDEADQVGNNRSRNVGSNETIAIGNDRSVEVGNNHDETIAKNENLTVGEDRTRTAGKNESVTIGKNQDITAGENRSLSVGKDLSEDVGASRTLTVGKDMDVSIGGKCSEAVSKEYSLNAKKIVLVAEDELSIKVGSAQLTMKKNGDIDLKGKKINIKGSGDVILKGSKVLQN